MTGTFADGFAGTSSFTLGKKARNKTRPSLGKTTFALAMLLALGCGKTGETVGPVDASGTGGALSSGGTVQMGTGGQAGAAGAGGQTMSCGSTPSCAANARRCGVDGVPETCVTRPDGCRSWEATNPCSAHQACVEGTCACADDPRCGTPAAESDFCPTAGAATFGHCAADADGCFFAAGMNNPCTDGEFCKVTGSVPTGTACGCPADGTALGTGCSARTVGDLVADAAGGAILACAQVGSCHMWKVMADCASQGLAAGLLATKPACVCAEPTGHFLYADPAPAAPAQSVGAPTGAKLPAACRLPSITAALAKAAQKKTFDWIVAIHDTTPFHLGVATGEAFPLTIPAGVTVSADEGAGVDSSRYTLDVKGLPAPGSAVLLGDGATLSGFTIDAGGAAGAMNAGSNVTNVVACAVATKAQTATLDHISIKAQSGMTGVSISGACSLVGAAVGVSGATIGVDVVRTATGATDVASLTATELAVISAAPTSIGLRVGTGADAGARSSLMVTGGIIGTTGAGVVVAGGTAQLTSGAISFTSTNVGSQNRGIVVSGGAVTLNGVGITMGDVTGTNAIGAELSGGTSVFKGVAIAGVRHVTGMQISGLADVTVSGTALGKSRLSTTVPATTADPSEGLVVLAGATGGKVKLHGSVDITGFNNGVVMNDGALVMEAGASGEVVTVTGNRNDGVQLLARTAAGVATLAGSTFRDNVGKGLVVRTLAPVTVTACTISGNGGDGIDVQRSQTTTQTILHQFAVSGSTVSGNAGRGIALTGKGTGTGVLSGGKVGAALTGNVVSLNGGVGVFVSEATDNADGDDITEVWIEGNEIAGNLTSSSSPSGTLAGGVFFASADATTRILLRTFFGNRIHGNGYAEVGFNLIQNDAKAWNLSSNAVDAASVCAAASMPNYIYCYGSFANDYAIAVSATTIHINAKGTHFQNSPAVAGRDYSPGIPDAEVTSSCTPQACQ